MKLLIIYIVLNIVNVLIQTIKSITTIKGGKAVASITNAVAYGLYTVVVVYMMCDLPLWLKAVIIGLCNLVGVYIVKAIEEKKRKDKVWKIEVTTKSLNVPVIVDLLNAKNISYNYVDIKNNETIFNIYANTQKDSAEVKNIIDQFEVKYFVTETKIL